MATAKASLAKRAWETFSKLNVNEHTEKKGNLTYLSWTYAVQALMEHYPESTFEVYEPVRYGDGSVEVRVAVTLREAGEEVTKVMWLPVMDNRNNAIKDPDARKISDSKMRCLVKCISLFGLGLYIYAGEDLPIGVEPEPEPLPLPPEKTLKTLEEKLIAGKGSADDALGFLSTKYQVTEEIKKRMLASQALFEASQNAEEAA
jgi:hypothetical protein